MANARLSSLSEQRSKYSTYNLFSGKRRVSTYGSLGSQSTSLARQTLSTELKDMEAKYQDGLVGNEEMKAYYQKIQNSGILSDSEKISVQSNLREFDDKIRLSALEATYKNAGKSSMAKITAAKAIAAYYKNKTSGMQTDTPAYSAALESAGQWEQAAVTEADSMEKQARANQRAIAEQSINSLPTGSSDRAMASAQSYMQLYQQALNDGDTNGANKYLAQAQQQQTLAGEYATRESTATRAETRKAIVNDVNQLANAYHDGKITATQFLQAIPALDARAAEIEDISTQNSLNRWSDSLYKDVQKGVKTATIEGLTVRVGRGGKGTGGKSAWQQYDDKWVTDQTANENDFQQGLISPEAYMKSTADNYEERAGVLQGRLEELAQMNPDAKVRVDGRLTSYRDLIARYETELYDKSQATLGDSSQDGGMFQVLNDMKNLNIAYSVESTGNKPPRIKMAFADDDFKSSHVAGENGLYYPVTVDKREITQEEYTKASNMPAPTANTGGLFNKNVEYDSTTGRYYAKDKHYVDVYDNGQRVRYYVQPGQNGQYTVDNADFSQWGAGNENQAKDLEKQAAMATQAGDSVKAKSLTEEAAMKRSLVQKAQDQSALDNKIYSPSQLLDKYQTSQEKKFEDASRPVVANKPTTLVAPDLLMSPVQPVTQPIVAPKPTVIDGKPQLQLTQPIAMSQPPIQQPPIVMPSTNYSDVQPQLKSATKLTQPAQAAPAAIPWSAPKVDLGQQYAPPTPVKQNNTTWTDLFKNIKNFATNIFKR